MTTSFEDWTVLPHEPIQHLAENLWTVQGTLPHLSLRRNMTIVRLADGGLVIHSPIALDERSRKAMEAWGHVEYIVIPNGAHRLDAKAYKRRYPSAKIVAPSGQRTEVGKVVPVELTFEEFALPDRTVELTILDGMRDSEGAMIVHSSDGTTVVLADAIFNMDRKKDLLGRMLTTLLDAAPGPRVSRVIRLIYVQNKKALRAELERFADLPDLVRVIVAHEKIAHGSDAREALRTAAASL